MQVFRLLYVVFNTYLTQIVVSETFVNEQRL
nr:MAG TPA: hypothetical protein [Crassvirales sp.]